MKLCRVERVYYGQLVFFSSLYVLLSRSVVGVVASVGNTYHRSELLPSISNGEMTNAWGESHLRTIVRAEIISEAQYLCGLTGKEEYMGRVRDEMENEMF